jgi:EAL domain-containing protein (putative c-di-GMP-specific phosphodiesterase class I)
MEPSAPQGSGSSARKIGLACAVELAHRHLALDVVFIAEISEAGYVYREAAGDRLGFGVALNEYGPTAPYYRSLSESDSATLLGDLCEREEGAALQAIHGTSVRGCVAVPLRLADGSPFGVLCGLSRRPRPELDMRDAGFMAMLGDVIVPELAEYRRQSELRLGLLHILEDEDVQVAYQPIIDLHTSRCMGIEALARFPEPFARPDWTLKAAEALDMRLELERLIVIEAWEMIPKLGPDQFLGLNLAPDALLELARRANLRDDLPLAKLVIEVTEHSAVDSYGPLLHQLTPLREKGLRIAVDDAGAGFASLRHVLRLRPDFVKVDRSLIDGIASDHAKRAAVGSFVSLSRKLNARVIAEGVERATDLETLTKLGLDAAQGFLLGRPTTDRRTVEAALSARRRRPRSRFNSESQPSRVAS